MLKFKTCNLVVVVIVFVLTLYCCMPVFADDTSLGRTPEGVFPMQENDVIMESEEITVDLEKNSVECIFVFHNTGKSKNVFMGFPGKLNHEEDGLTQAVNLQLSHFKTFVKGKELPVTREKSTPINETINTVNFSEYFTFSVPFKEDEKIMVKNTYDFTPTYDSMGYVYSGYVLQTGAMWRDPIGYAKVTFKLGSIQPYEITKLKPSGFKFAGNELVWERKNFEPTYDLHIEYNTYRYSTDFIKNLADDEYGQKLKQEIKQRIDSYNMIKELANEGETDKLLASYKKAVEEKDSILALYIRSYLPLDKLSNEITSLGNISIDQEYGNYFVKCDVLGPEAALVNLKISHFENGSEIQDFNIDDITSIGLEGLTPGIEYTITYTLTDWLDRTEQKTIKYIPPEKSEVSAESQIQPSASDEISSMPSTEDEPVNAAINEAVSKSTNETSNETSKDSTNDTINKSQNESANENSDGTKLIFWVVLGLIVVAISVLSVMMLRKKQKLF